MQSNTFGIPTKKQMSEAVDEYTVSLYNIIMFLN